MASERIHGIYHNVKRCVACPINAFDRVKNVIIDGMIYTELRSLNEVRRGNATVGYAYLHKLSVTGDRDRDRDRDRDPAAEA